jgi:hypothetical protein
VICLSPEWPSRVFKSRHVLPFLCEQSATTLLQTIHLSKNRPFGGFFIFSSLRLF